MRAVMVAGLVSISMGCGSESSDAVTSGDVATGDATSDAGDGSDGTDATDGSDGTDASDATDGSDGTDGTDGIEPGSTIETALPLALDESYSGTLDDPETSELYIAFEGKAGDAVRVSAFAKQDEADPFTESRLDLFLTVIDADEQPIALNDDPWPLDSSDPDIITVLPADGTYVVIVNDCHSVYDAESCAPLASITDKTFEVGVFSLEGGTVEGATDQDGTTANALPLAWTPDEVGSYFIHDVVGTFAAAEDVDVYSVTIPADVEVLAGNRAHLDAWLQPIGLGESLYGGNGATSSATVWLSDPDVPSSGGMARLDQANFSDLELSDPAALYAPVTPGKSYNLHVARSAGAFGDREHYVLKLAVGNTYDLPVEKDDVANGVPATAEVLTVVEEGYYAVSGDLAPADGDQDHFSLAIPADVTQVEITCAAARVGSGLQGFKFQLTKSDGTLFASDVESETASPYADVAVPSGETALILKVSATGQSADVSGAFYECGVFFYTP